jgi:hypothetical protein
MAARVQVDRGLGSVDVRGNFEHRGNEYVSAGYASAADQADIRISGGLGRVTIEQEAG